MNDHKVNKRQYLICLANYVGVRVATYSPGDGVTRYRFFLPGDESDYFGPGGGLGTSLGISAAIEWLEGYRRGREAGLREATAR